MPSPLSLDYKNPYLQPKQQPQPQQGFNLMDFLSNAVKEATYLPRGAAGALFEVGRGGLSMLPGVGDNAYINQKTGKAKQNPFLSEEELGNISKHPVKEGTKLFASGASYAVPFGKGAQAAEGLSPFLKAILNTGTKAVLPGAAVGGLNAYANDKDVVGGAVAGGATAGALKAGGNALQGILRGAGGVGQASQQAVVRPFVRDSAKAAQTEGELVGESKKFFSKFSSAQGMREQSAKIYNETQNQINEKLPTITKKLDFYKEVLPKIYEHSDDAINKGPEFYNRVDELVNTIGKDTVNGKANASLIDKFKNKYGDILHLAFDKTEKGTALSQQEDATLAVWESLDDIMRNSFHEIKDLTVRQSLLHRLAPGLRKSAQQGIPGNFLGIPLKAATRPIQAMQNAVGRGLEGGSDLANKEVPNPLMQILMQGGSRVGSPEVGQVQGASIPEEQVVNDGGENSGQPTVDNFGQGFSIPQAGNSPTLDIRDVLALSAANPQASELFRYLYEQGQKASKTKLPAALQGQVAAGKSSLRIINELENQLGKIGLQGNGVLARIVGAGRTAGSAAGLDKNVRVYQSTREAAARRLIKAMGEVGTLSKSDIDAAVKLIPGIDDSSEEAAGKLQSLRNLINSGIEALQQPSGGEDYSALAQMLGGQ